MFKSSANLKTILASTNKSRLPKNSHPGVYMVSCKCEKLRSYKYEFENKIIRKKILIRKKYIVIINDEQFFIIFFYDNINSIKMIGSVIYYLG